MFVPLISIAEKETILLLGGCDEENFLDSILILKNNGERWKEATVKLPFPAATHGAQFLNNHLYIFGGNYGDKFLNCTYKLSKKTLWYTFLNGVKWEKMTDMNEKRSFIFNSNVILNGRIWVCGGWNGRSALKSVEIYNPETNEWKYVK